MRLRAQRIDAAVTESRAGAAVISGHFARPDCASACRD
jgi:hypothetical protein